MGAIAGLYTCENHCFLFLLRCGLLTEAFLALRCHCHCLAETLCTEHKQALVVHLAERTAESCADEGAAEGAAAITCCSLEFLCELPWDPVEEDALIGWLMKQLQEGKSAGNLLPLYFLSRGHLTEAIGAYNVWQLKQQSVAHSSVLMDAMVNMAAGLLPLPQQNVHVVEAPGNSTRQEALWPAKLLVGLSLQADNNVPMMSASLQNGMAPPFMASRLLPLRSTSQAQALPDGDLAHPLTVSEQKCLPKPPSYSTAGMFKLPTSPTNVSPLFQPPFLGKEGGLIRSSGIFSHGSADPRDPKRARILGF